MNRFNKDATDSSKERIEQEFEIRDGTLHKYRGADTQVIIPEGVDRVNSYAFSNKQRKKIRSIRLPGSLTIICELAFEKFTSLEEICIPGNVTDIGNSAFSGCTRLKTVRFENPDIVSIDNWAFEDTPWLNDALKKDGALIVGSRLIRVSPELNEFEIPSQVTDICGGAFQNSSISSLIVPEGVVYIGRWAFDSSKLRSVTLPESLEVIDEWAFAECEELQELTIPEKVHHISSYALYNLPNCVVTILNGSEDDKTEIYDSAFGVRDHLFGDYTTLANVKEVRAPYGSKAMRCAMLWDIPFTPLPGTPEKYTYIDGVFCCEGTVLHQYLGHEKTVRVPDGITEIGYGAFMNDYGGVEHVILPESVTEIQVCAFTWCVSLKSVVGPGVKVLGSSAFSNCVKLQKVEFPSLKSIAEDAFLHCISLTADNLSIPDEAKAVEKER